MKQHDENAINFADDRICLTFGPSAGQVRRLTHALPHHGG